MPELPEVETSRRGIEPHLLGQQIKKIVLRYPSLRWLIPKEIPTLFASQTITAISRRGKYLLLTTEVGSLILHLGMSGSLRIVDQKTPVTKHDHVDVQCSDGTYLRFNDPRRFGCLLYTRDDPLQHKLLQSLGVEPLSRQFNAAYLWGKTRGKQVAIKQLIMNSKVVVGVGNIYANEALFQAGILPTKPSAELSQQQAKALCRVIKTVLNKAIKAGGTTLKDFSQTDGKPGYFAQKLQVYGKAGLACPKCKTRLCLLQMGGRQTVCCFHCQT